MVSRTELRFRMAVTMAILLLLYLVFGYSLWTEWSPRAACLVIGGLVLVQYVLGIRLAVRKLGSRELTHPRITNRVAEMADTAGMNPPDVYVTRMRLPNAFAVGWQNNGKIVLDETLVEIMDDEELEGIVAHELAHLKNNDSPIMMAARTVLLLNHVRRLHLFIKLLVLALSRYREYVADRDGAQLANNPTGLARALVKLNAINSRYIDARNSRRDRSAVDSRLSELCIVAADSELVRTHPPVEKRVHRLDPNVRPGDPRLARSALGREGRCPSCDSLVYEAWSVCPNCSAGIDSTVFSRGEDAGFDTHGLPDPVETPRQCSNCGAVIEAGWAFCGDCGTSAQSAQSSTCPACGATIPDGQQDCPECVFSLDTGGEERNTQACDSTREPANRGQSPAAGREQQIPDNDCPHCGATVDGGWNFCKGCGGDLS